MRVEDLAGFNTPYLKLPPTLAEAVVRDLERRLDAGELRDADPATQLALTRLYRGRILDNAGRHAEAEARYGEALEAAERVGDLALQDTFLQRLGGLQRKTGRTAESVDTLRRTLRLFQQSGDRGGEMRTCDLLGTTEQMLGRPDPADAWYRKALDLARDLGGQRQIGATRQNLGILLQTRA